MAPASYGGKYQEHYLEQHQLCVEMAEAANQWKDQINRFYLTLFSILAAMIVIVTRMELPDTFELVGSIDVWSETGD